MVTPGSSLRSGRRGTRAGARRISARVARETCPREPDSLARHRGAVHLEKATSAAAALRRAAARNVDEAVDEGGAGDAVDRGGEIGEARPHVGAGVVDVVVGEDV